MQLTPFITFINTVEPPVRDRILDSIDDRSLVNFSLCSKTFARISKAERKYREIQLRDNKFFREEVSLLLIEASSLGSLKIVIFSNKNGADLNHKNSGGITGLHLAVKNRAYDVVEYLCEQGADLNVMSAGNNTALHRAAGMGDHRMISMLLTFHAKVDLINSEGFSPLHLAAVGGWLKCVLLLHKGGADLNRKGDQAQTPLHLASVMGHIETVAYLCDNGAQIDPKNHQSKTPLLLAFDQKKRDVIRILCEKGANLTLFEEEKNVPIEAVLADDLELITYFCEIGAYHRQLPLQSKENLKKYAKKTALFEKNANLDKNCQTLLAVAVCMSIILKLENSFKILKNAHIYRKNALWQTAVKKQNFPHMIAYLKQVINSKDCEQLLSFVSLYPHPALFFQELMVLKDHEDLILQTIETLLKYPKFDRGHLLSDSEMTLLRISVQAGMAKIVQLLVEQGMNPRRCNQKGEDAFHLLANVPNTQRVAVMLAMDLHLSDATSLFGIPYSPKIPDDDMHRSFRSVLLKKAANHLNQIAKAKDFAFKNWLKTHFKLNRSYIEAKVDTLPHLFLMKHYFHFLMILSDIAIENGDYSLRIRDLSTCDKITALTKEQFIEKNCTSICSLSFLLNQIPNVLKPFFQIEWELHEEDLQTRLNIERVDALRLILKFISRQINCKVPLEVDQEGLYLRMTPTLMDAFIQRSTDFEMHDFEGWRKLASLMVQEKIIDEEGLEKLTEKIEKSRIEKDRLRREEIERETQRYRFPKSKNPSSDDKKPVLKKVDKKPHPKTSGSKKPQTQKKPLPPNPPRYLPPLEKSAPIPLAPAASFQYDQATAITSAFSQHVSARPEPITGGFLLISASHQAKTQMVKECFERLALDIEGSSLMKFGARLCNWMLIDLACDSLPLDSPLREMRFGMKKSTRGFWAHHCFPKTYESSLEKTDNLIFKALETIKSGNPIKKDVAETASIQMQKLFEECEDHRIDWKMIFTGEKPDPRPLLTALITQYVNDLSNLKKELTSYTIDDTRYFSTLDAIVFFVSRIGELVKHFGVHSKLVKQLRNEILHCFEINEDAIRETLHVKCLSLLDKIIDFKLPEMTPEWNPYINMNYCYSVKLVIALLRWKFEEQPDLKAIIHDEMGNLKEMIQQDTEKGFTFAFIPLKLANRKLAILAIKLDQKVKIIEYIAIDSDQDSIPESVIKLAATWEIKKIVQSEKKGITFPDHGPLLIERIFQWAKNKASLQQNKMGSVSEIRRQHLFLGFKNGSPELYFRQYLLKGQK